MKYIISILFFSLSGCIQAADTNEIKATGTECDIAINKLGACEYQGIKVTLVLKSIASDENELTALNVHRDGEDYSLNITPDISMLSGDKGYILFEDINFDNTPDLAISTSFGLANQLFDYWVFDKAKNHYSFVGNYARLSLDAKHKLLTNEVKINAVSYKKNSFAWKGGELTKTEK